MAILQAIFAFVARSVGKIFSALFDWAVVALFGRVSGTRKTVLSVIMAAAAAWPILLIGVVFPKASVFVLGFIPLSHSVPSGVVRVVWILLALLVPIGVGIALRLQRPPERGRSSSTLKGLARGFPITLGLATAFAILLVTVPVLRIVSAIRGRRDVQVPLVTTPESYRAAASLVVGVLRRHGIDVAPAPAPWWMALPSHILLRLARGAFEGAVLEKTAYFRNDVLEAALYPNALLLRGGDEITARAHALTVEAIAGHPDMFQTTSPRAQDLERQIQRVWATLRLHPGAHVGARPLLHRLDEIAAELARRPLPFEEWQIVYRESLQLERALHGERQILESTVPQAPVRRPPPARKAWVGNPSRLSTPQLVKRIAETGSLLVEKEVALAREELKADVKAELGGAALLGIAAVAALTGAILLVLTGVFVIARWIPAWAAALGVAAFALGIAGGLGFMGWGRVARRPLTLTVKTLMEDWQWVKERMA